MSPAELRWLAERARACQVIVEFGSFKGRSTRALADHCSGVVYAVDPWIRDYPTESGRPHGKIRADVYADFEANLRDHLASGRVRAVQEFSGASLPALEAEWGRADLVFIDGDHREAAVREDIIAARVLVRPGTGIIAGHDYTHSSWPGVKRAVDALFPRVGRCESIWWVTA